MGTADLSTAINFDNFGDDRDKVKVADKISPDINHHGFFSTD